MFQDVGHEIRTLYLRFQSAPYLGHREVEVINRGLEYRFGIVIQIKNDTVGKYLAALIYGNTLIESKSNETQGWYLASWRQLNNSSNVRSPIRSKVV
jgi:hypothetical protein